MPPIKTVDEYIHSFPKDVQSVLETIRETIKAELPEAEETISYNLPTYKIMGKNVIYFSGWRKHTSLYPFSMEMEEVIKEAAVYKTSGKGTIQFSLDKPLPLQLIRRIVQFRLNEITSS